MADPTSDAVWVEALSFAPFLESLFTAAGLSAAAARTSVAALIESDLEGTASHGVMRADLYLDRLRSGSMSAAESGTVVSDIGAVAVLDAGFIMGHLAADQAMAMAVRKAVAFGIGVVACRRASHFGAAGRYVRAAAAEGCIGIAMCNTVPFMPAPGGAERVLGNNPLAIAVPSAGEPVPVLDMAMSAAAFGKIRLAAQSSQPIPAGWAVDADGRPTTDAAAALAGILLPVGGPKGFGLALMVDLIAGLLSGGVIGADVPPLYGDVARPFECSTAFIAIDLAHFGDRAALSARAGAAIARIRRSRRAGGVDAISIPGDRRRASSAAAGGRFRIDRARLDALSRIAGEFGLPRWSA